VFPSFVPHIGLPDLCLRQFVFLAVSVCLLCGFMRDCLSRLVVCSFSLSRFSPDCATAPLDIYGTTCVWGLAFVSFVSLTVTFANQFLNARFYVVAWPAWISESIGLTRWRRRTDMSVTPTLVSHLGLLVLYLHGAENGRIVASSRAFLGFLTESCVRACSIASQVELQYGGYSWLIDRNSFKGWGESLANLFHTQTIDSFKKAKVFY
jgi:hypothetical protein